MEDRKQLATEMRELSAELAITFGFLSTAGFDIVTAHVINGRVYHRVVGAYDALVVHVFSSVFSHYFTVVATDQIQCARDIPITIGAGDTVLALARPLNELGPVIISLLHLHGIELKVSWE